MEMTTLTAGVPETVLTNADIEAQLDQLLLQLGPLKRVLLIPPDHTRSHSYAGELTVLLYRRLSGSAVVKILPALGTHAAMTASQIEEMFPGIPATEFLVHNWRTDLQKLGVVPGDFIAQLTGSRLNYAIECEVNRILLEGNWDRIISIGQVVPHEVVGMANHAKNIFVGTGGWDTINKTHYVGAVCGMEGIMGRADTPVRAVLNYMSEHYGRKLPLLYLLTVRGRNQAGDLVTRGLYAGENTDCFYAAARLSQLVNLDLLEQPLRKVVVYLAPGEFHSTWLGNKAIYRTRMAIADGGELVVIAPAVSKFGEDRGIDQLIRKYGYRGTAHALQMVNENADLGANLAAAAHLVHGSSEDRFQITYCPGQLTADEVRSVGYEFAVCGDMLARYDPARMRDGLNTMPDGEEVFWISNPALGLWALRSHFEPTEMAAA
jgi:nickel-dependent lactate racemase